MLPPAHQVKHGLPYKMLTQLGFKPTRGVIEVSKPGHGELFESLTSLGLKPELNEEGTKVIVVFKDSAAVTNHICGKLEEAEEKGRQVLLVYSIFHRFYFSPEDLVRWETNVTGAGKSNTYLVTSLTSVYSGKELIRRSQLVRCTQWSVSGMNGTSHSSRTLGHH